jgi:hypothetical protein
MMCRNAPKEMKWFIAALMLISTAASAEHITTKIPWKGDYPHNSSKTWSTDNSYDSGFSKNFLNGAPEEGGKVQKEGELDAEIILPEKTTGPIPFVLVLHGGYAPLNLYLGRSCHKRQGSGKGLQCSITFDGRTSAVGAKQAFANHLWLSPIRRAAKKPPPG